jgi:hypothetical protein
VPDALCPRCLEDELRELRQRLAARGEYVTFSPGPNPNPRLDHELTRWLAVNPRATAADGFRAGWERLARVARPKLREWQHRYQESTREIDSLRSRIGVLIMEIGRLSDRG